MSDQPRTIELKLEPATIESFAPYGVIPPFEGDGNPTANLVFTRDDGWVNFIGHSLGEIEVRAGRLRCELLNRHDTHTQTLMPMTGDALVVVAPAEVDFSAPEHLHTVKAFALPQYACVHLHRGTWHWGPYPVGADELRVFNIQASGWPTDNSVAELTRDHGVVFEVIA
jgi:ureidoglycolate hydrolase